MNKPRIFQRYVTLIFEPLLRKKKILLYLDDILVTSRDLDEHLLTLPSEHNIEAVVNYPVSRNAEQVQRFTCLASYFRHFISGFSVTAKSLYNRPSPGQVDESCQCVESLRWGFCGRSEYIRRLRRGDPEN